MKMSGRAWILGDGIDTDVLAPGAYMSASLDILSSHCLAAVRPDFASAVRPGDVILAGSSFGVGSSREQAAEIGAYADGVIVGSALVSALKDGIPALRSLTEELADGVRQRITA